MQIEKKTLLFLLNKECTYLPPFMTILESLCEDYCLKVISCEKLGGREKLEELYKGKDVSFLSNETQSVGTSFTARVGRRVRNSLHIQTAFHKEAERIIASTPLIRLLHFELVVGLYCLSH